MKLYHYDPASPIFYDEDTGHRWQAFRLHGTVLVQACVECGRPVSDGFVDTDTGGQIVTCCAWTYEAWQDERIASIETQCSKAAGNTGVILCLPNKPDQTVKAELNERDQWVYVNPEGKPFLCSNRETAIAEGVQAGYTQIAQFITGEILCSETGCYKTALFYRRGGWHFCEYHRQAGDIVFLQ